MPTLRPRSGQVLGPTDRVVVVGAGLAGLSAALRLAGAGREVTVLEREHVPGGRAGAPRGRRLPVRHRSHRADHARPDRRRLRRGGRGHGRLAAPDPHQPAVPRVLPRRQRPGRPRRRRRAWQTRSPSSSGPARQRGTGGSSPSSRELYRLELRAFIDSNFDSPLDLVGPDLARLVAIGGFRRLASKVDGFLRDPRTRRVFSFQAMYAGLSPQDALALYAVISYMDCVAGVFVPEGGMHAVPRALAGAAEKHGVTFRYGTTVQRVEHDGRRASGVITTDGERIEADVVVLNPDLPVAYRDLLGVEPWSVRRLRHSPSCAVLHVGLHGAVQPHRPPQHPLRAILEPRVPRGDRRGTADERSQPARHQPLARRPEPGPRGPRVVLRAVPRRPTWTPRWTGRSRVRGTATTWCHTGAARLCGVRRRPSRWST